MQITRKGQVTIPQEIRNQLGLLPTEVEFEVVGDHTRIRKRKGSAAAGTRGQRIVQALRGTGNSGMTTDEIMALTRGEVRPGLKSR